jgi:thiamine-phosphate pyrophosphorylase
LVARLPSPCLAFVTDRKRCAGRPLEAVVDEAVSGGVNLVQLREKDLPASELYTLAVRLRDVVQHRALFLVNDRVDVALACSADGVQLGERALPIEAARAVAVHRLLIGRSVHSVEAAIAAANEGADLLVAGTVFPSASHPEEQPQGLALIEGIAERAWVPILAIGGITAGNVASVMRGGASGAAVITAISLSPDPRSAARELFAAMAATPAAVKRVKP